VGGPVYSSTAVHTALSVFVHRQCDGDDGKV